MSILTSIEVVGARLVSAGAQITTGNELGGAESIASGVIDALSGIGAAVTEGKSILAQAEEDPAVWATLRTRFGNSLDAMKASFAAHPGA